MSRPRTPIEQRFWAHLERGALDECWEWKGKKLAKYGMIRAPGAGNGDIGAHRIAYELMVGGIPLMPNGKPFHVLHRCDNPPCCNPKHLFLGTQADNIKDMVKKGRHIARRGEHSGMARLTECAVIHIRRSALSERKLARELGVSRSTVNHARSGRTWAWLQ